MASLRSLFGKQGRVSRVPELFSKISRQSHVHSSFVSFCCFFSLLVVVPPFGCKLDVVLLALFCATAKKDDCLLALFLLDIRNAKVVNGWVKHLTERPFATLGGHTGCITGKPSTIQRATVWPAIFWPGYTGGGPVPQLLPQNDLFLKHQ
jgi:hypothetical protein